MEKLCYALTLGSALWLASCWLLALAGCFTRSGIIVRSSILLVSIGILLSRRLAAVSWDLRRILAVQGDRAALIAIAPLCLWLAFIVWRGAIIPPVSHDALAYHLPKATILARDGAYHYLPYLHWSIRTLPMNYELLLAESIVWQGSDAYSVWLSAFFYVYVMIATGALVERWWGRNNTAIVATMMCVAACPVALLHSGAHKSDLMFAAFLVAAVVATGRFLTQRDSRGLILVILAMAAAGGVKPHAGFLLLAVAPVLLFVCYDELRKRTMTWRFLAAGAVLAVFAFVLLGGAVYISNVMHEHSLLNPRSDDGTRELVIAPYGDYRGLWQGPYVLLAAPFATDPMSLSVPWERRPWFWQRYEVFFSHMGAHFTFAALIAPFAALCLRNVNRGAASQERVLLTLVVVAAFLFSLPVGFKPHGMYQISLPRYVYFVAPVVFAWGIAPVIVSIGNRRTKAAGLALSGVIAVYCGYAADCAVNDRFAPLSFVMWARAHPGTRRVPFSPYRAACIVDELAGPRDAIAVDADYGTWIQPAYGARLERRVDFIPPGNGVPQLAPDVRWVIIDRAAAIAWWHPEFKDLSQWPEYLNHGPLRERDMRVFTFLSHDRRFRLVSFRRDLMQAVFERVRIDPG